PAIRLPDRRAGNSVARGDHYAKPAARYRRGRVGARLLRYTPAEVAAIERRAGGQGIGQAALPTGHVPAPLDLYLALGAGHRRFVDVLEELQDELRSAKGQLSFGSVTAAILATFLLAQFGSLADFLCPQRLH